MAYKHLNVTLPWDASNDDLCDVVKAVKPEWDKNDLDIKCLSGGFINKLFGVRLRDAADRKSDRKSDGVVIRISADSAGGVGADRHAELRVLLAMNSHGLNGPLLASFNNGLVFTFYPGHTLTDTEMRDKRIIGKVAEELARMHATLPLETDERADPLHLTRTTFEHVPKTLNDPEAQKRYSDNIPYEELKSEITALHQTLLDLKPELAIGHGDLWQGNILFDPEEDRVHFVDFEQSGCQFAAFDIAFYLVCLAATPPDYSVFRHSDEDRRCFINCYLQEKLKVQGTPMSADQDEYKAKFKELYTHVCKCELLALLHILSMCLFLESNLESDPQANTELDYLSFGTDAWNEFKRTKAKDV